MTSILYIGMDVHTTNYTLCSYSMETQRAFGRMQVEPDYKRILQYIQEMKKAWGDDIEIVCGYEAGCLGYSLYHSLTDHGVNCVILAPSTMACSPNERKTDMRDAEKIAKCLAYGTYSPVYVPTQGDEAVKEYIRMRDAHKANLKRIKQQIIALCHRYGKQYAKQSHWTQAHLTWLKAQRFNDPILQETFEEYLIQYHQAVEKLERFDKRILEISGKEEYAEKVHKLISSLSLSRSTPVWKSAISTVSPRQIISRLTWGLCQVSTPAAPTSKEPASPRKETLICEHCSRNPPNATAEVKSEENPRH